MLIAQALVEYGMVSALVDGMYWLRVYVEEALRTQGLSWLGIAVALYGVWFLIRR
jgi:hypothetical protein